MLTGTLGSGAKIARIRACEIERPATSHPGMTDCGDDARYVVTFPDGGGTLHVCEYCCEDLWERDGAQATTERDEASGSTD